jgi:hypothetical protein
MATRSLIHSAKQSKLARVFPFPKPKKPLSRRRVGRAVLQSAMRDRLRAYRADDPQSYTWVGWVLS